MENGYYFIVAFSAVWIVLFLYLNYVQRKMKLLLDEIEELKAILSKKK